MSKWFWWDILVLTAVVCDAAALTQHVMTNNPNRALWFGGLLLTCSFCLGRRLFELERKHEQ